jgi:hypothetical protein
MREDNLDQFYEILNLFGGVPGLYGCSINCIDMTVDRRLGMDFGQIVSAKGCEE